MGTTIQGVHVPGAPIPHRAGPIRIYNSMFCRENFVPTSSFSSIPLMWKHFCAVAYILLMSPFFNIFSKRSRSFLEPSNIVWRRSAAIVVSCSQAPFARARHDISRAGWNGMQFLAVLSFLPHDTIWGDPAEPRSFSKKSCLP